MEILNFLSNKLESISPNYRKLNKDMKDIPTWYKLASATTAGFLVGTSLGCRTDQSANNQNNPSNPNSQEHNPNPETELYPTKLSWLNENHDFVKKVSELHNVPVNSINAFEISIGNILSADGGREVKVQFVNFVYPGTNTEISLYFDKLHQDQGLLNQFSTVNRGGGPFVERQMIDLNNHDNSYTLLVIPPNAEEMIKSGQAVTMEFNPPEWIRIYLPSLEINQNLKVEVPPHPDFTKTVSLGFVPDFLVTDGSVEGIQTPAPNPEFTSLQEQIAAHGEIYTLNADGQIEMQTQEGMIIVPDIQVHPDGTMTFTYDGQEMTADTDTLEINDQTITFKDQNGKTWVFDGKELAQAPEYLSSADGTVLWTKESMANGELRVKDEKAKELRNDTLKALWAVNNALVNPAYINDTPQEIIDDRKAFLAKFPIANALINYVENGGEPVDFIYIPVNNTKALSGHAQRSCEVQKIANIDLSKIVIGFDIVPKAELLSENQTFDYDYIGTPYCDFEFMARQFLIDIKTLPDGAAVLSWKFRNGIDLNGKKSIYKRAPLYSEQSAEDKLVGISDLARATLKTIVKLKPEHANLNKAYNPPALLFDFKHLGYYTNDSTPSNSYFELP